MNANERLAKPWVSQAARDLQTARKNFELHIYEVCCFLCEQVVQKLLKAYLLLKGERRILTRSTFLLAQMSAEYEPHFASTYDACRRLDIFYTPSRYPDALGGSAPWQTFGEVEATEALAAAKSVFESVGELFPEEWLKTAEERGD